VKPHSEACERNREPILQVLRQWFVQPGTAMEIGAGTGQHAVHFAAHLPHLQWQPTDCEANLAGIGLWVSEAALPNLRAPLKLDVRDSTWPVEAVDYVFSANTSHIMSWPEVELMFAGIGRVQLADGSWIEAPAAVILQLAYAALTGSALAAQRGLNATVSLRLQQGACSVVSCTADERPLIASTEPR